MSAAPERLFLRRAEAGQYLKQKYGFGSGKTLAKFATEGNGPEFFKAGNIALYSYVALDTWARAKLGAAHSTTAEHGAGRPRGSSKRTADDMARVEAERREAQGRQAREQANA